MVASRPSRPGREAIPTPPEPISVSPLPENTYCHHAPGDPWHEPYHDEEYGFPLDSDDELFGRLLLEINQAGLSWITILKKADNFRKAYRKFDIAKVAKFTEKDRERLLSDAGLQFSRRQAHFDGIGKRLQDLGPERWCPVV